MTLRRHEERLLNCKHCDRSRPQHHEPHQPVEEDGVQRRAPAALLARKVQPPNEVAAERGGSEQVEEHPDEVVAHQLGESAAEAHPTCNHEPAVGRESLAADVEERLALRDPPGGWTVQRHTRAVRVFLKAGEDHVSRYVWNCEDTDATIDYLIERAAHKGNR